jgi:hypothetical protein
VASSPFLGGVATSQAAARSGLRHEKNPAGWLAARLKATVDAGRGTVTLRLVDCPRKDAVVLLSAVVEAYGAKLLGRGRKAAQLREREVLVQLMLVNQQANVWGAGPAAGGAFQLVGTTTLDPIEVGPSKAEVDGSVLQAPRVVQPGLPGKESPARWAATDCRKRSRGASSASARRTSSGSCAGGLRKE